MSPRSRPSNTLNSRVLLGSLLLGLAGLAQAQTSVPAGSDALLLACQQEVACQSHLDSASVLYKQQRYSMALEEYQAAYLLQPYPPFLYNIARLHHKQDHLSEAVAYYQRYLDSADPGQPEKAKQYLTEAQQRLAAEQAKERPAPAPIALAAPAVPSIPFLPVAPPAWSAPAAPAERKARLPGYKQWWVWALCGAAAAGAATAIGIGVYASGPDTSGLPVKQASLGQ